MFDYGLLIGKIFGTISSWIDAANLRNKVYALNEENELLRVALSDIIRMCKGRHAGTYASSVLEKIDKE